MKKLFFIIAILFAYAGTGYAQPKGFNNFDLSNAVFRDDIEKDGYVYDVVLLVIEGEEWYTMPYKRDLDGLKKVINDLRNILIENGISIDKPDYKRDELDSNVDNIYDYDAFQRSIESYSSKIYREWVVDGWTIYLSLGALGYSISLRKIE